VDGEPFDVPIAGRLIRRILTKGQVAFTRHARDEMAKDDLDAVDVTHVLRAGRVQFPEFLNGSWRYRVSTRQIFVVVAFRSQEELVVVTVWRR